MYLSTTAKTRAKLDALKEQKANAQAFLTMLSASFIELFDRRVCTAVSMPPALSPLAPRKSEGSRCEGLIAQTAYRMAERFHDARGWLGAVCFYAFCRVLVHRQIDILSFHSWSAILPLS